MQNHCADRRIQQPRHHPGYIDGDKHLEDVLHKTVQPFSEMKVVVAQPKPEDHNAQGDRFLHLVDHDVVPFGGRPCRPTLQHVLEQRVHQARHHKASQEIAHGLQPFGQRIAPQGGIVQKLHASNFGQNGL